MANMLINRTKLADFAFLFLVAALAPATICAMEYQSRYVQAGTVPTRLPTPFPGSQSHTHNYNYSHAPGHTSSPTYDHRLSPGQLSEIERRAEIETEEKSREDSPEAIESRIREQEDSPEVIEARIRENEQVYASLALELGVFPCVITLTAGRSGSTTTAYSDPQYGSDLPYGQIIERDSLFFKAATHKQIMLHKAYCEKLQLTNQNYQS